jgi:branched-chain amino acid transport system ATP-binding protein
MLEIREVRAHYGPVSALNGVSLSIPSGEIISLLGANGAGKSTLLGALMGIVPRVTGSVVFVGQDITNAPTERIVKSGMVLVPEGRQLFGDLTVDENLWMGAYLRDNKAEIVEDIEKVRQLFPRLAERRRQLAGSLSGGEQQMLAIGRGYMSRPKIMLLDEPSLGLAPVLVVQIMQLITDINRRGVTILLVEQNARQALRISRFAYVIEKGRVVTSGPAADLVKDRHVVSAYLGG